MRAPLSAKPAAARRLPGAQYSRHFVHPSMSGKVVVRQQTAPARQATP